MNFNWDNFNKESFKVASNALNENDHDEFFIGSVRTGDLCFDIVTRDYNDELYLDYDMYIGGVDTGYGYSDDYPYDYHGGGSFALDCCYNGYENFKVYAENVMQNFIEKEEQNYKHASLIEKANQDLNLW